MSVSSTLLGPSFAPQCCTCSDLSPQARHFERFGASTFIRRWEAPYGDFGLSSFISAISSGVRLGKCRMKWTRCQPTSSPFPEPSFEVRGVTRLLVGHDWGCDTKPMIGEVKGQNAS